MQLILAPKTVTALEGRITTSIDIRDLSATEQLSLNDIMMFPQNLEKLAVRT